MTDGLPLSAEGPHSAWYADAMEHMVDVVQALSDARDIAAIAHITGDAARNLTGADGATFVLRDGDEGVCVEQTAPEPMWKGRRFPLETTVSGRAILTCTPIIIEDVHSHPWIPNGAYRPEVLKSMAVMPIRKAAPVGAIVIYWATSHLPNTEEIAVLQALANITSVAWENVRLLGELQDKIRSLEAHEAQIREQHESLEVFTHALAHDLREPVRTVRAFTDLIMQSRDSSHDPGSDPGAADDTYFEFIRKAADRMGMLVDTVFTYTQLHDPARISKAACAMDNMLTAAQDNLRQLIVEHDTRFRIDPLPSVHAHAGHMMQVLQNLIANAIKHSHDRVTISVTAQDHGDHWRFCVADDGPGIAPEDLARIFQPFKRLNLNEDGAGLGLSICSKIVSLHGGRLWCESKPGEGAVFCFTLPQSEERMSSAEASDKRGELARVLLVDDREADIELTRILLTARDRIECDLSVARSGREALGMLRDAMTEGSAFDLILLDINMPGMDGFETLAALRGEDRLRETAVVMCTGSVYDKDIEQARGLGAAGYMVKPASLEQLRPMVESLPMLKWQRAGQASRLLRHG